MRIGIVQSPQLLVHDAMPEPARNAVLDAYQRFRAAAGCPPDMPDYMDVWVEYRADAVRAFGV